MDKVINAEVPREVLKQLVDNLEYNKVILDYYEKFSHECGIMFSSDGIQKLQRRMAFCNKYWLLDVYKEQKIKDFQKTHLCSDKFCSNCKKVKQASRMARYIPEIEKFQENLYHLTLTLPNCSGTQIRYTYDKMARAFKRLIRYLTGNLEVKDFSMDNWGYMGAVRSLEITFRVDSYHPHFHIGLVMECDLGKKNIENKYSWDYKSGIPELKRLFCEKEILIQKLWYLILNDIKVTKKAIDELELGYSCTIDKFTPSDYAELFKYMTKETSEDGSILTYENFVNLLHGLYNVKQIQGYGCLYRIKDEEILEEYEAIYNNLIQEIRQKENPMSVYESPRDLLSDTEYKLISRKTYFKYLRQI